MQVTGVCLCAGHCGTFGKLGVLWKCNVLELHSLILFLTKGDKKIKINVELRQKGLKSVLLLCTYMSHVKVHYIFSISPLYRNCKWFKGMKGKSHKPAHCVVDGSSKKASLDFKL